MIFEVGAFEVEVWTGGYPVWTSITRRDRPDMKINGISHKELSDLKYAVDKAIKSARLELKKTNCDDEI